jgi:hypothetical protein
LPHVSINVDPDPWIIEPLLPPSEQDPPRPAHVANDQTKTDSFSPFPTREITEMANMALT